MNNSDFHIDKKARLLMSEESKNNNDTQEVFTNVGDQVQSVDNTVRQTGAADAEGHPVQEVAPHSGAARPPKIWPAST